MSGLGYEVHWVSYTRNINNIHGVFSTMEEAQDSVINWWKQNNFEPPYIRQWCTGNKIIWDYGSHTCFYEFHKVVI